MPASGKKRAPSAFNLFMKKEIGRVKNLNPNLSHQDAFKAAAQNWKKGPSSASPSHPKKGQPSRTRKGRLDFVTHKGDKCFHKGSKRQCKSRKPYQKTRKKGKKGKKGKK